MKKTIILILLLIQATTQAQFQAQWNETLSQQPMMQMQAKTQLPVVNRNTEAVQYHYALDPQQKIADNIPAYVEQSRQFWLDTDANGLAAGIDLPLSGTTAFVRISPLTDAVDTRLNPQQLQLQASSGEARIETFVDAQQLNQAGASFSDHTIAFKVHTSAAGELKLSIPELRGDHPYVVNVLEPQSPLSLKLTMDQRSYASNSTARIVANMVNNKQNLPSQLQGYVRSADGSVYAQLRFQQGKDGSYAAEVPLRQGQSLAHGLWEVHAVAESRHNGVRVLRDAQSSFAVHMNTARFSGALNSNKNSLDIGVEVAQAGRYEVRGVLMGTDRQGQLQPLAMLMSARWLNAGNGNISFDLEPVANKNAAFTAPFVIRQIQLTNQSLLAPVQSVNSGITLSQ